MSDFSAWQIVALSALPTACLIGWLILAIKLCVGPSDFTILRHYEPRPEDRRNWPERKTTSFTQQPPARLITVAECSAAIAAAEKVAGRRFSDAERAVFIHRLVESHWRTAQR